MRIESEIQLIFLLMVTTFTAYIKAQKNLYLEHQWKYLDFQFPNAATRDFAIRRNVYIKGNSFPYDIDVYNGGRSAGTPLQFVTMPRVFDGTPITLGTITDVNVDGGPVIAPYPNYDWNKSGNCSNFINVFRVSVDECERLWVLDSGVINDIQVCPPKLVMFDLRSDDIPPFVYEFPDSLNRYMSLFSTLVVDARLCYDSMVYISDVRGFGIIVYDYKNNKSWRTESQADHLKAIKEFSKFTIGGESFTLMDGVFGLTISPKTFTDRQLFFHALASTAENRIPLSVLDNPALWKPSNPITIPNNFVQMGLRETTQTTVQAMDQYGNMFFGTINPPGIGCWDSTTPYTNANLKLVARNDATLQFISGLKVVTQRNGSQELWVLSCRLQKIIKRTRNVNEVNYRVQKIPIHELLNGKTRCNGPPLPRN